MSTDREPDGSVILLSDIGDDDGADRTFRRVVERIREAAHSIVIHMFVWRNDEIGNRSAGRSSAQRIEASRSASRRTPVRTPVLH